MTPLAHAGGIDEIAYVLLPGVILFFILQYRRKRAEAREAAERAGGRTEDPSPR